MKTRTMYMHTLNGKPASMRRDGTQIVFADGRVRARLCNDLQDIRRQQRRSRTWRAAQGFGNAGWYLGYVLVEVPTP